MSKTQFGEPFDDDIPVGRILSRREAIAILGGTGLALLTGCGGAATSGLSSGASAGTSATATPVPGATATPTPVPSGTCVVRPALTIGPFFVDERLNRSDIRSDPTTGVVQSGVVLNLTFQVSQLTGGACSALSGAMIDIWEANALGKYSDESSEGTLGQKYLRGYQVTNSSGIASFTLIYPGWYSGRTVHTHFRVRNSTSSASYDFISQLFYDEAVTAAVLAQTPYSSRGSRDTTNATDSIYVAGGSQTLVSLTKSGAAYSGTFALALQL